MRLLVLLPAELQTDPFQPAWKHWTRLVVALQETVPDDEIRLVVDGPDLWALETLRASIDGVIPQECVVILEGAASDDESGVGDPQTALMRAYILEALLPDAVLACSASGMELASSWSQLPRVGRKRVVGYLDLNLATDDVSQNKKPATIGKADCCVLEVDIGASGAPDWIATARAVWVGLKAALADAPPGERSTRRRMAFVSPLPPVKSGIADYSANLLPALARHFDLELVVDQPAMTDPHISGAFPVRDAAWLRSHARDLDVVLYQIGNSYHHDYMLPLLQDVPGIVVLHDFFLSDSSLHRAEQSGRFSDFPLALFLSHGYLALAGLRKDDTLYDKVRSYPASFPAIENSHGVLVHSDYARRLAADFYGDRAAARFRTVAFPRIVLPEGDKASARQALDIPQDALLVCSFGYVDAFRLTHRLLEAILLSDLNTPSVWFVCVGQFRPDYKQTLDRMVFDHRPDARIRFTDFVSAETYKHYLDAADAGVQLRTASRGETSAALFDCMSAGLATMVNASGSFAEISPDCVISIPDEFSLEDLVAALNSLADPEVRATMGGKARRLVMQSHVPERVAAQYVDAIDQLMATSALGVLQKAADAFVADRSGDLTEDRLLGAARLLTRGIVPNIRMPRLFVDVSHLIDADARTGIERATRSLLECLLHDPLPGYRIEVVYLAMGETAFRHASRFMLKMLDCQSFEMADSPVDFYPGDIVLNLGLAHDIVISHADLYRDLRNRGVRLYFYVFDILPIQMPHMFLDFITELHPKWLAVSATVADGLICISRTVSDDVMQWLDTEKPPRERPLKLGWIHLGADLENSTASKGLPADSAEILGALGTELTFLMVGTLEPRKGYSQVVDAFNRLWQNDFPANLVIVGKQGWNMDRFAKKLRTHLLKSKRLFWIDHASDEFLEKLYAVSDCLIAASEGEGFGLPLIEAARHGLPLLVRDIPVFREVAGDCATYFAGDGAEALADAVLTWADAFRADTHRRSDGLPWVTWSESATKLKSMLNDEGWHASWPPVAVTGRQPDALADDGVRAEGVEAQALPK